MFRACISSGSRAVASASASSSTSQTTSTTSAFLHTSSILHSEATKQKGLRTKKINIAKTEQRLKDAEADKLSVVLGTRPSEEHKKWGECLLSRVLVDQEALNTLPEEKSTEAMTVDVGALRVPKQLGFGVDSPAEKKMLFGDLPLATAQMGLSNDRIKEASNTAQDTVAVRIASPMEKYEEARKTELHKATMFAKVLDLRNANAKGIAFENRRRIIMAFSTPENPFDTGRTEVQVALLTYKIRNLWSHLTSAKRDVGNRRGLAKLIHQRAKLLRYLKNTHRDRYDTVLEQVALDPASVEGELVV